MNLRPDTEAACAAMIAQAVVAFGGLDSLVVASGMNKVAKIDEMAGRHFWP